MKQPSVLIVDDEEMVLGSLVTFLALETEYDVFPFSSPKAALLFLETGLSGGGNGHLKGASYSTNGSAAGSPAAASLGAASPGAASPGAASPAANSYLASGPPANGYHANGIDIIVSDFLMPEMDGIAFLTEARRICPEVPRVMLTGYADKENAVKAINQVGLYQFIEKPWSNDEFLLTIRNGIEKRRLLREIALKMDEASAANHELLNIQRDIIKALA